MLSALGILVTGMLLGSRLVDWIVFKDFEGLLTLDFTNLEVCLILLLEIFINEPLKPLKTLENYYNSLNTLLNTLTKIL